MKDIDINIKKIGIIGTGRIARRFIKEAYAANENEELLCVVGAYNPHADSTKKFVTAVNSEDCIEMHAYDTMDALFMDSDIIYIASPHETHYEYAKKAINAGKHVLCEKPMCFSKTEATYLFTLANKKDVVLIEGLKTAFCPGYIKLLEVAKSGAIGEIKNIEACFTKLEDKTKRELTDVNYGGSFTELGSYVMLPVLSIFSDFLNANYDIRFDRIDNNLGIDIFTRCTIKSDSKMATLTCGLGVKSEGRLLISGTEGYIVVPAPWWKTSCFEVHYEDATRIEKYEAEFKGDGLRYEINTLLKAISLLEKKRKDEFTSVMSAHIDASISMAAVFEKFYKF